MISGRRNVRPPVAMPADEKILALDCSGAACSAAVWRRGAVVAARRRLMARGHAEAVMPMLVATMAEAGETFRALTAVAATVGPGAFTGIRIGLAAARGIALAAKIPVAGITTFAAVAESVVEQEHAGRTLLVILDSKRGDVFVQEFAAARVAAGAPAILSPAALGQRLASGSFVVAGDGIAIVRSHLDSLGIDIRYSAADRPVDARWVAQAAVRSLAERTVLAPTPLYLRAPEVRSPDVAASASATADR